MNSSKPSMQKNAREAVEAELQQADLQAIHARFQAAWDDHRDAFATFVRQYPDEKFPHAPYPADDPRMAQLIETRAKAKLVEEEYRAATKNFLELKRTVSDAQ